MATALVVHGIVTVLKATLILVGAGVLAFLLRRGPAAIRHALWTGTLAALVALPFLPLLPGVVPSIRVSVPLPVMAPVTMPVSASSTEAVVEWMAGAEQLGQIGQIGSAGISPFEIASVDVAPIEIGGVSEVYAAAAGSIVRIESTESVPPAEFRAGISPLPPLPAPEHPRGRSPDLAGALLIGWVLGVLGLLGMLALGLGRSRRVIRGAIPVTTPDWQAPLDRARRLVGLRTPVSLRVAPTIRTPMAGGMVRPAVLLPTTSFEWETARRECVLLHEVVHLRRRDPARQILGRVAIAIYWFHPLVWWAVREAASAREEACDERVVELGCRPSDYARHLLGLTPVEAPVLAGLAGFHHPDLEKRLMSILNPKPRAARGVGLAAGVAVMLWATSIAALTPVARQASPPAPDASPASDTLPVPISPITETPPVPISALSQLAPLRPFAEVSPTPFQDPPDLPPVPDVGELPAIPPVAAADDLPPFPPVAEVRDLPPLPRDTVPVTTGCPSGDVTSARVVEEIVGPDGRRESFVRPLRPFPDGQDICIRVEGNVTWAFDDTGTRIRSMEPGSTVQLLAAPPGGVQRLEITPTAEGADFAYRWFIGDEERPVTPRVMEWRDAFIEWVGAARNYALVVPRASPAAPMRTHLVAPRPSPAAPARTHLDARVAELQREIEHIRVSVERLREEEIRLRDEVARAVETRGHWRVLALDDLDSLQIERLEHLHELIEPRVVAAVESVAAMEVALRDLVIEPPLLEIPTVPSFEGTRDRLQTAQSELRRLIRRFEGE